jgi:hypothetical protein
MKIEGTRKFIVTLLFGSACFWLCHEGHMSGGETVTVVSILSALYKAANLIDKNTGGAG